jgi:AraC family transcriptional activator of tynA and feaB
MTLAQSIQSAADQPSPEILDFRWRDAARRRLATMDLRPLGPVRRVGSFEERDLGDLLITDWDCPPVDGVRRSNAARRDEEALLLFTAAAGRQIIETPKETVVLRRGTVLLMSTRATGRFAIPERLRKRTVRISMTALSPFVPCADLPECLSADTTQSPLAKLLQDFLEGIAVQSRRMSAAEIESSRNALLALIAGVIRSRQTDLGGSDFLPLLRRQIEAWIVQHLSAGPLRVRDIAAAHSVARRTVHRAFASTGDTVGAVIRRHRLAAARHDLVNTSLSISTIACRWGFSDASHFGREFRREFSASPGEYRGQLGAPHAGDPYRGALVPARGAIVLGGVATPS